MTRLNTRLSRIEEIERARLKAAYAGLVQEFCHLLTPAQRRQLLSTMTVTYPQLEVWSDTHWRQVEDSAPLTDWQHNIKTVASWIDAIRQGDFAAVLSCNSETKCSKM